MKKAIFFIIITAFLFGGFTFAQHSKNNSSQADAIAAKDFNHLLGTLNGISDELLKQHFKLYEGYVKSLNNLNTELKKLKNYSGNATYSTYRAVNISKPFAQNGVMLHEMFFSNLSGKETTKSDLLNKHLNKNFGPYENYISELKEAAKSARAGWVMTAYNNRDGKIYNYIIDLHDEHVPLGVSPLLVLDVWEHAYILDYGIDKASYIDALLKNIDWNTVSSRFDSMLK